MMLALAPTFLVLAAVASASSDRGVTLMVRQGLPEACNPKCTNFNQYYKACVADEKSAECLAVCEPTEFTPYQECLNCVETEQPGVSFKSTLEKVQKRCVDNGKGDPTNGAGIQSVAVEKNETDSASESSGTTSAPGSSTSTSTSAPAPATSAAAFNLKFSVAGITAAVIGAAVLVL